MHKSCFGKWVLQKKALGTEVTCPFWYVSMPACLLKARANNSMKSHSRTPWQVDDPLTSNEMDAKNIKAALDEIAAGENGLINEEGYVNIAHKLGLSGERGSFEHISLSLWRFMEPFTFVYS